MWNPNLPKLGLGFSRRWISNSNRFAALWGNGDYGRLGLGNLDSQWSPTICRGLDDQNVKAISCGGAHTLFLTEAGRVFATGLNDFGQVGVSLEKGYTLEPLEVSALPKEIIHVSAGYHHSSAVTVDGELYMWGNNSSGQLGLGKSAAKKVPSPSRVDCLNGVRIKMTALGSEHSVAITDEGETLSWGAGGSGRLGHGHQSGLLGFLSSSSEFTPRLIKTLEGHKVTDVSAGFMHSACIDENGTVFIFGERSFDKLGFGKVNNATSPSMVNELPNCRGIACGGYHTCVITIGGELYTWGSNENGCLGIGCIEAIYEAERVEGPFLKFSVSTISCGWKHTAAVSGGKVFTWGWGGSHGTFSVDGNSSGGQLGHGNDIDYYEPMMVNFGKNIKVLDVSCGFNHTGAILEYTQSS
ncbi:HECT-type E3 ubiquitin transferase [Ranunculus cassubicifolius]